MTDLPKRLCLPKGKHIRSDIVIAITRLHQLLVQADGQLRGEILSAAALSQQEGSTEYIVIRLNGTNIRWTVGARSAVVARASITEAELEKTAKIFDVLLTGIQVIFGREKVLQYDFVPSLALILGWVLEDRWIVELKYHLNSFFCLRTEQELPDSIGSVSKPGHFLCGALRRFVQQHASRGRLDSWAFLNTILNGFKKGLPTVSDAFVEAAALKHKERLSRKRETPEFLLEEVERTGLEIWKGKVICKDLSPLTTISTNACVESSKAKGGALGQIIREALEEEGYDQWDMILLHELIMMKYGPHSGAVEIRGIPYSYLVQKERESRRGIERCFGETRANVKFILEPLKVRPITALGLGHNALYPEIQEQLWNSLQGYPQFCLTGRPVSEQDILDLRDKTRRVGLEHFTKLVSGDYSGATDSCHMDLSLTLAKTSTNCPFVHNLLVHNLAGQDVCYVGCGLAEVGRESPDTFRMTNGQLMGSRHSFPFLCAFNAAIYRCALERRTKRRFSIRELPVLVNGDDILFFADDEMVRIWEELLPQAGLEKSIGKNFVSDKFCTINSCLFRMHGNDVQVVPYLNMGMVSDQSKRPFPDRNRETESERFKRLLGSFRDAQYLGRFREHFEAEIRSHRKDVWDSHIPSHLLGFTSDSDLLDREEMIRTLIWEKEMPSTYEPQIQSVFRCHTVMYGGDCETVNPAREAKVLRRLWAGKTDSQLLFAIRRMQVANGLIKARNRRWDDALDRPVRSSSRVNIGLRDPTISSTVAEVKPITFDTYPSDFQDILNNALCVAGSGQFVADSVVTDPSADIIQRAELMGHVRIGSIDHCFVVHKGGEEGDSDSEGDEPETAEEVAGRLTGLF